LTTYPSGTVSTYGQNQILVNQDTWISYVGVDGSIFYLAGPLAPVPGAQNGIALIKHMGLMSPFNSLSLKGARQDGETWTDTVYDSGDILLGLEASGLSPQDIRDVIRHWISAWEPNVGNVGYPTQLGKLCVQTPDMGEWWANVRLNGNISDQFTKDYTWSGRQQLTWKASNQDAFWYSVDSTSSFGADYAQVTESFANAANSTTLGTGWTQSYTGIPAVDCAGTGAFAQGTSWSWAHEISGDAVVLFAAVDGVTLLENDSVGTGAFAQGSSFSWVHQVDGNAVVVFAAVDGNVTVSSVECGVQAMTKLGSIAYSTNLTLYAYGLIGATAGTQTITLTTSATCQVAADSVSYYGVESFGTPVTTDGSGTTLSQTVSSSAGQIVAQAFAAGTAADGQILAGYNQTELSDIVYLSGSNVALNVGQAAGASSVPFTAYGETSVPWGSIAVPVLPDESAVTVTASVGSTPMTSLGSIAYATDNSLIAFGLLDPPTGTQTVTLETSGGAQVAANSVSYFSVDAFGVPVTTDGTGTALSQTVSSNTTEVLAQAFAAGTSTSGQILADYNQVDMSDIVYLSNSNVALNIGYANGANSVTFSATGETSVPWGSITVPLLWGTPGSFGIADNGQTSVSGDSVGTGAFAQGTSWSWLHQVDGTALVVWVAVDSASSVTLSVDVGGVAMTELGSVAYSTDPTLYAFGLIPAPQGTEAITVTASATCQIAANSVSYYDVSSFGTPVSATGTGTSLSQTVASGWGNMVAQAFAAGTPAAGQILSGYNQQELSDIVYVTGNNVALNIGQAEGASTVEFTAEGTQSGVPWGALAVPLIWAGENVGSGAAQWISGGALGTSVNNINLSTTQSDTNDQIVSVTLAGSTYANFFDAFSTSFIDLWARCNVEGTTGVRCRLGEDTMILSCFNDGVETDWVYLPLTIPPLWGDTWTLIAGDATNPYDFTVQHNGFSIWEYTDTAQQSQMGSSYRYWGFGVGILDTFGEQSVPLPISEFSSADNVTVTQSGYLPLTNIGDVPAWPRYLCYGPGTFSFGDGPGSTSMISFGPILAGQVVLITTDPRLRSVIDLTPNQPPQVLNQFQQELSELISYATNGNVPPLLQQFESWFGILPPQGNLYSLLNGRFTTPLNASTYGSAPQAQQIAVTITDGGPTTKVVAAITPRRRWPL
jgi:hypothetical protein